MKILGISGSPRSDKKSGCYKLTKAVLEATGMEYELISLRGKDIKGCTACLKCVEDNVCVLKDDMADIRQKLVEADAFVIGGPNYYAGLSATMHAFLERMYQFRHREVDTLWGKLMVAVGVGGGDGEIVTEEIERFMGYRLVETVAKVAGQGEACCFSCGYGETCKVGRIYRTHGEGFKITEDTTPDISKQPKVLAEAEKAGNLLGERLANHSREDVTRKMIKKMNEKFKKLK